MILDLSVSSRGDREFSLYQYAFNRIRVLELERSGGRFGGRGRFEEIVRGYLGKQLIVEWKTGSRLCRCGVARDGLCAVP